MKRWRRRRTGSGLEVHETVEMSEATERAARIVQRREGEQGGVGLCMSPLA